MRRISDRDFVRVLDRVEQDDSSTAHCQYPPSAAWTPIGEDSWVTRAWRRALRSGNPVGLYVHIPFCAAICRFCSAFPRFVGSPTEIEQFLKALEAEVLRLSPAFSGTNLVSLFLGGGTPNLLEPGQIRRLFSLLRGNFSFSGDAQVVVEVVPEFLDRARLKALVEGGVTGLSLGVQTLDDRVTEWAGHPRDNAGVKGAFFLCREAGIRYILVDLLSGLPGQTEESFLRDVRTVASWGPEDIVLGEFSHVNTPFEASGGRLSDESREGARLMAEKGFGLLGRMGYSRFGNNPNASLRPHSSSSKHNFHFYGRVCMLGLGPGAVSYARGQCWYRNRTDFPDYADRLESGRLPVDRGCRMNRLREMINFVLMGVDRGWISSRAFGREFGVPIEERFGGSLGRLISLGILKRQGTNYRLRDQDRAYYECAREFFEPGVAEIILRNEDAR